jgi:hypothetical protein
MFLSLENKSNQKNTAYCFTTSHFRANKYRNQEIN